MATKRMLMVADMHCLSHEGLSSADWVRTAQQRKILSEWETMWDEVGYVDMCLVGGDATEGNNYKSSGKGVFSADMMDQCYTAAELLSMGKVGAYRLVQGSHYHTGMNPGNEQIVAMKLDNAVYSDDALITIDGLSIHVSHKNSVGQGEDRKPNAAGRHIGLSMMNERSYGKIDIEVRAHTHYFVMAETAHGMFINLPSWKISDSFVKHQTYNSIVPDRGWVMIEVKDKIPMITKNIISQTRNERWPDEVFL